MKIEISNPQRGIGPSAFMGVQEIRGLNISDKPGVCYPNLATRQDSDVNVTGMILQWATTASGAIYGHDGTNVYYRADYDDWTPLTGHNAVDIDFIFFWKDYIGIIQGDDIGWFNSGNTFVTTWTNCLSAGGDVVIEAQDACIYINCGTYLDKLSETVGETFLPTDTDTYTINQKVITFPSGLGSCNKMFSVGDYLFSFFNKAIIPWNCAAVATSFESPVYTPEDIQTSVQYNKTLYFQMGYNGDWFLTNGTTITRIARLPRTMFSHTGAIYTYGACVHNGLIFFGVGGSTAYTPQGIYSIDPEIDEVDIKASRVNFEYIISNDSFGATNGITFGDIYSMGATGILIPWASNSVYKVDSLSTSNYTDDKTFLISQFYQLGTSRHKGNIPGLNINLSKPLSTGDTLKIYTRTAQNGSWTLFHTMSTGQTDFTPAIPNIENIQFEVILNNNVELINITGESVNQ